MTALETYLAHLMQCVRQGDPTYARYAAKRYAKTDPFNLSELPVELEAAIKSLASQSVAESGDASPTEAPSQKSPSVAASVIPRAKPTKIGSGNEHRR